MTNKAQTIIIIQSLKGEEIFLAGFWQLPPLVGEVYSQDFLHARRRCLQLSAQETERVDARPPCQQLLVHHVFSRSHWVQQSVSRDVKVEQLKVGTHSKTSKTIKPNCFLFNIRSFHLGPCLPAQTHWARSPDSLAAYISYFDPLSITRDPPVNFTLRFQGRKHCLPFPLYDTLPPDESNGKKISFSMGRGG